MYLFNYVLSTSKNVINTTLPTFDDKLFYRWLTTQTNLLSDKILDLLASVASVKSVVKSTNNEVDKKQ